MSVSQKIKKHWNTKLIYSRAFRAPALLTLYYGGAVPLKPEKIRNLEAELAYEPRRGCFAKLAVYQVHIKDPIVYSTNGFTDVDEFTNKTRTGSYGAEIEGRYVAENWFFYGSYTYAHQYRNEVQNFKVRADSLTTMLAFPLHKLAANFNYIINKQFILNCGLLAESRRFGYDEDSALRYFAPVVLVNASLTYRHPGKLFEAQVAVMDLLNQQYTFPQAYRSAYGSLPGPGRELLIRLKINLHERPEN